MEKILKLVQEKKHPLIVTATMLIMIGGLYAWNESGQQNAAAVASDEQVAQVSYTSLTSLPGQQGIGTTNAIGYLENLIFLGIGLAIVLAVLVIVIAGIEYMGSDAFTKKEDAKNKITMAIFGLAIAFGGYLLLETINPDLVVFKFSPETRNVTTVPLPSVKEAENAAKTGTSVTGKDLLGRKENVLKYTNFDPKTGKYFEAVVTGNVSGEQVKAAGIVCSKQGGEFSYSYLRTAQNFAGTYVCEVKQ
ncbi:MAG: hypothetical protein HYT93_02355 [Parcubacteria group bacterium]|nr:hypothetical protein [Parcubacteria group bacterium]